MDRLPPTVPLMWPKLTASLAFAFGKSNCGVLVTLKASARTSMPTRSVTLSLLDNEASRLKSLGPANAYRGTLPITPFAETGQPGPIVQKAEGLNHGSRSIPPSTLNGAIWIGVWRVPGALSELPFAEKSNGRPLINVRTPPICHPPATKFAHPDCSQGLPLPKGSS